MTTHVHVHWPPLALALALAMLGLWLNQAAQRPLPVDDPGFSLTPDYVVKDFDATVYGVNGRPKHRITAKRLSHNTHDDASTLESPHYQSSDSKQKFEISARKALLLGDSQQVYFLDEVHVVSHGENGSDFTMDTGYLVVHPDRHIMRTNKPITLRQGRASISAGGLLVNDANKQISLTGGVRGTYEKTP